MASGLLQGPGFSDVYTQSHRLHYLLRGAGEPAMRPQHPAQDGPDPDDAHSDNCVIESLRGDRVRSGQAEDDGDGANKRARRGCDRTRAHPQIEGPFDGDEVLVPDYADQDRESVRDIQADGCDRSGRRERYRRAERRQRQDEGECCSQPDGADRRLEAVINFVEEVRLRRLLALGFRISPGCALGHP